MDNKNKVPEKVDTDTLEDVQQKAELGKQEINASQEQPEEHNHAQDNPVNPAKGEESNPPDAEASSPTPDSEAADQEEPKEHSHTEASESVEPDQGPEEDRSSISEIPEGSKAEESKKSTEVEKSPEDESVEEEDEDEEEDLLDSIDLESASKDDLHELLRKFAHEKQMRKLDRGLKAIKQYYDQLYSKERDQALREFIENGAAESDFDYKGDETDRHFFELYDLLREKKYQFFSKLEGEKEENLKKKNEILEQLRELVDGEESTASINTLKELQSEWKKIGHVPGQYVKNLWANYNALIDRFYDHRSIYFELKELDRQKNLKGKLELCKRAEDLDKLENIKDAIFQLNELHEEFKHIGPIPREDQEPVWQRFKAASDKIYDKRREFYDTLKKDHVKNMEVKRQLGVEAESLAQFDSEKIGDWNAKTKEILELQKKWEATGSVPRDHAKVINKQFWSNFKQFFNNKNTFFKKLEGMRDENLKLKEELVQKAEAVKDSSDWDTTANLLKQLQNDWKEIGPVPEKVRNEVYRKFKGACDHFFERKRSQHKERNKEFDENLKKKEWVCEQLEACMESDVIKLDELYDLLDQYAEIGFVPRHAIKSIHNRFDKITSQLIGLEELSEDQRTELKMHVQVNKLKGSPHGDQKINRKENAIKRKITNLENDINLWKTNLEFFANSKTADKLKDDFLDKIENAEKEVDSLKKQLDLLNEST